jgi:isocitrate dehydrogenase
MPNLYGDILSDVAAQISGSVGLAGSANIGDRGAMFEAIHGSAPRRAGQNVANPSGLLIGAVQMLAYLGQTDVATRIHNGWLRTLEEGIHTYDVYKEGKSRKKVGTKEFADAVIAHLDKVPQTLKSVHYSKVPQQQKLSLKSTAPSRHLVGLDVFLYHRGRYEDFLAKISHINVGPLRLQSIANRGVKVWPEGQPETFCVEQWRCRFSSSDARPCGQNDVIQVLQACDRMGLDIIQSEHLYTIDGKPGYSSI